MNAQTDELKRIADAAAQGSWRDRLACRFIEIHSYNSGFNLFSEAGLRKELVENAYAWADALIEAGRTPSAPQTFTTT